uniref:Putative methyltransferase n=1 Tax=viral metagenome TaxID=1070528 RepID=A0A6M3M4K1_9ZZZZ
MVMSEMPADRYLEFYDAMFRKDHFKVRTPWYALRNKQLLSMVKGLKFKRVFEFAGATGLLSGMLLDEHPEIEHCLFSDLSPTACKLTERFLKRHLDRLTIKPIDIVKEIDEIPWEEFDLVISTSLEHLPKGVDFEILKHLPEGCRILWSLATFETDSKTHLHPYPSVDYVEDRFKYYLTDASIAWCDLKGANNRARYFFPAGSLRDVDEDIRIITMVDPVILLLGTKRRSKKWQYLKDDGYRGRILFEALESYLKPGDRVADICCGYSPMAKHLVDSYHCMGFDLNGDAIKILKDRFPEGEWVTASYTEMTLKDFSILLLLGVSAHQIETDFHKFLSETLASNHIRLIMVEVKLDLAERPWMQAALSLEKFFGKKGYERLSTGDYTYLNMQRTYTFWGLKDA